MWQFNDSGENNMPLNKDQWIFASPDGKIKNWNELYQIGRELKVKDVQKLGAKVHKEAGDNGFNAFLKKLDSAAREQLPRNLGIKHWTEVFSEPEGLSFSAGSLVVLAGELCRLTHSISEGEASSQRFLKAYHSFYNHENKEKIEEILKTNAEEEDVIRAARHLNMRPCLILESNIDPNEINLQFNNWTLLAFFSRHSEGTHNATSNLDLGLSATQAYLTGHLEALNAAELAHKAFAAKNSKGAAEQLKLAFRMELFACGLFIDLLDTVPKQRSLKLISRVTDGVTTKGIYTVEGDVYAYCVNNERVVNAIADMIREVYEVCIYGNREILEAKKQLYRYKNYISEPNSASLPTSEISESLSFIMKSDKRDPIIISMLKANLADLEKRHLRARENTRLHLPSFFKGKIEDIILEYDAPAMHESQLSFLN